MSYLKDKGIEVEYKEISNLNTLNLGPTHPATHGIFQNVLTMNGEIIEDSQQTIGYIHRAFEKIAERRPYNQITVLTDRMNYCSSPINNLGWHMTVEKLIGVDIPKRAQYLRVIIMELARISDHIICDSVIAVDTGALTGFTYLFQWRELIYEIYEEICGARLTTNLGRIGGLERDFTMTAWKKLDKFLKGFPAVLEEFENLVKRNRIFMDRTVKVGPISGDRALEYGFTGPNLRAAGVDYDVRVMSPYSSYEDFDFIIPVGTQGDTYDRFMVRQEEIRQSLRIILQGIPEEIDMQTLTAHLEKFEQIDSIHDLHVWSIDGNYNVLTVHVVLKQTATMNDMAQLKADIRASLETEGIQHATIEFETVTESCNFEKCC